MTESARYYMRCSKIMFYFGCLSGGFLIGIDNIILRIIGASILMIGSIICRSRNR